MTKIKLLLAAYGKWIAAALAPLGIWGVFVLTAVDASLFGMPLDLLVATYIYRDPSRYLLYVLLAASGSATGSIVLYIIGYTGGEVLLRKRMSPRRFEKIQASFDKHEFWALMFPAMLPPPTPFKAIVLAAAVFEMRFTHFLAAIFAGRFLRFLIEGYLTIRFGPQFVQWTAHIFAHHFKWILLVLLVILVAVLIFRMRKKGTQTKSAAETNPTLRSKDSASN